MLRSCGCREWWSLFSRHNCCIVCLHWSLVTVSICRVFKTCQLFLKKQKVDSWLMIYSGFVAKCSAKRWMLSLCIYIQLLRLQYKTQMSWCNYQNIGQKRRRLFFLTGILGRANKWFKYLSPFLFGNGRTSATGLFTSRCFPMNSEWSHTTQESKWKGEREVTSYIHS